MFDADFKKGFELGKAYRANLLRAAGKVATMYSYNGVVLPALPEWDKTAYPYAVIALIGSTYYLFANAEPLAWAFVMLNSYKIVLSGNTARSKVEGDVWTALESVEQDQVYVTSKSDVIWVNVDVLSSSGQTVIFAASDPIPVYE